MRLDRLANDTAVISGCGNMTGSPRTFVVLRVLRGKAFQKIEPAGLFRDHPAMPSRHRSDRRFQKVSFTVKSYQSIFRLTVHPENLKFLCSLFDCVNDALWTFRSARSRSGSSLFIVIRVTGTFASFPFSTMA
jgi:hypothetical protein